MQGAPLSRLCYVQENRQMRFEEAYEGWTRGRLTQTEAALLLGQCERSFRRHVERYEADGMEGGGSCKWRARWRCRTRRWRTGYAGRAGASG